MMKRLYGVIAAIGIVALFLGGCDSTGADSGGSDADDGTVTVSLSGATDIDEQYFWVWLYAADEWNVDSPETILAAGSQQISGGTASFVLKQSDGNYGYTDTPWTGTGGSSYDLYIMSASEFGVPLPTSKITADYPQTVTIDGNKTVEVADSTMVTYTPTTGTLTIALEGAEGHDGEILAAGVFAAGDHPANDEPLAHGGAEIASGTATFSIEPADWSVAMEAGTEYGVFIVITLEDRGDFGPVPGEDLIYKTHTEGVPWYVDGDRTMKPAYDGFVLIPNE